MSVKTERIGWIIQLNSYSGGDFHFAIKEFSDKDEYFNNYFVNFYSNDKINEYPYGTITVAIQSQLESEFLSGNYENPFLYIQSKNFSKSFSDLYQLCYLKCIPILGNILEEKSQINLLFYRMVVFLLSTVSDQSRKRETANQIIMISFDTNLFKYDLQKLQNVIRELCEICIQIIIYIGLLQSQISDRELDSVLKDDFYKVDNKYFKRNLDDYFINTHKHLIKYNIEQLKTIWMKYVLQPIKNDLKNQNEEENNQNALFLEQEPNYQKKGKQNNYINLSDKTKEQIIENLEFMFNNANIFDSIFGNFQYIQKEGAKFDIDDN